MPNFVAAGARALAAHRAAAARRRTRLFMVSATAAIALAGLASAPPAAADVASGYVVGQWLGPAFGDTGRCGSAYAQLQFTADSRFGYLQKTSNCGDISGDGRYAVDEGRHQLRLHWEHCNTCEVYGYPPDVDEGFRLPDPNTLILCDSPAGPCHTYQRD